MDCSNPDKALETFVRIFEQFLLNKQQIDQKQEASGEGDDKDKEEAPLSSLEYKLEDILKFID